MWHLELYLNIFRVISVCSPLQYCVRGLISKEEKYGLGGARTTTKFYETFGIDVVKKTTERHLCQFVRNKMHDMFMPHLRQDGIGIDYSEIDFKWKDPRPNDP